MESTGVWGGIWDIEFQGGLTHVTHSKSLNALLFAFILQSCRSVAVNEIPCGGEPEGHREPKVRALAVNGPSVPLGGALPHS